MGRAAAREAGDYIRNLLRGQETVRCVFAAAPSQSEFLDALFADEGIDFSRMEAFHMDDYIGLAPEDPHTFRSFLKAYFDCVPLRSIQYMDGQADPEAECRRYGALLAERPVDIVFMGIGENGHIAFNDPGVADFKDPATVKVVELDRACREQQVHDGCFESLDMVPTHALTLTVPALLGANKHFCIVPAATKAQALRNTLLSPVSEHCPATILRQKPGVCMYTETQGYSLLQQELESR